MKAKRILGRGLAVTLALALSTMLLAAAIHIPATASWVMLPLMEHCAPPEDTHLPAEEYAPMVSMIVHYLQGHIDTFQHIYTVDGAEYAAFNAKEQHHMADVQALFRLCARIGLTASSAVLLLSLLARRLSWRAFRRTLISILAAVTAVIILACIDFNSLFVLFHKVAFTNDLWLLNPQTDLLIRLMPIEFFISYAAIIGGIWLLGMVGLLIFATYRIKKLKANEGE